MVFFEKTDDFCLEKQIVLLYYKKAKKLPKKEAFIWQIQK